MAMFGSGSFGFFLAGGYDLMASNALQGVSFRREAKTEMAHGLGATAELPKPTGIAKYTLAQSGAFFNSDSNTMHDAFKAGTTTARVMTFSVAGNTIGAPFVGCLGALTVGYEVLAQNEGLTKANADYGVTGHCYDGLIVQHWATKTSDWNTKSLGTVVDYTADSGQTVIPITSATKAVASVVTTTVAHGLTTGQKVLISGNTLGTPDINSDLAVTVIDSTSFSVAVDTSLSSGAGTGGSFVLSSTVGGAYGFQQVSAFSGFSGFIGKLRDSADDVTYADLITFVDVTSGPNGQAVTNGAETVDRYLSYDGNVTGSGSITVMAGLARL